MSSQLERWKKTLRSIFWENNFWRSAFKKNIIHDSWLVLCFISHTSAREGSAFCALKKKRREKLWKQRRVESNGEQHFLACSATCLGCERCFSWTAFPRLVFPPGTFNSFHILFGFNNFSASSSSRCSTPLFACLLLALCSPGVNFPIISFI